MTKSAEMFVSKQLSEATTVEEIATATQRPHSTPKQSSGKTLTKAKADENLDGFSSA